MTKCKNPSCQNEVVSIEGRRPKEFCSPECRTKYHNSKNSKGVGRGRPKGSKNKSKEETPPVEKNSVNVGRLDIHEEPIPLMQQYNEDTGKGIEDIPFEEVGKELLTQIQPYMGAIKEATNEMTTFGTVTTKTEVVDGKASVKVVDKKKVVNDEEPDWKPKLSPFMLARQKAKGGGK